VSLTDRGKIAPGMKADLVLFDPATVIDRSTFEEPRKLAEGIVWVAVNGQAVWEDGKPTGARPGRVLTGKGAR
jgi:N-acyl-D-aspartate/D-glutamate deacylase